MAEYVTATMAKELGLNKDTQLEREYAFKSEKERRMERLAIQEEKEERERQEKEAEEEAALSIAPTTPLQEPAPIIEIDLMSVRALIACYSRFVC